MKNSASQHLTSMTEIERQLLIDRVQYRLDEEIKKAFQAVLEEVGPLCPFDVMATDLLREIAPDNIDCYSVIDEIAG
jgi:hypothetical protein